MAHECGPAPEYPNHNNRTLKLSGIIARLQSIMYTENLTSNELVQCSRIVRRSNREMINMQLTPGDKKEDKTEGETLYCSFCQKSQHSVVKLIAGPGVYICNECVDLCDEILCKS